MLQPITPLDAIAGIPGLVLGFIVGYALGASKSLSSRNRLTIAIAVGLIAPVIVVLVLDTVGFTEVTTFEVLLSFIATFAGIGFGAAMHWEPFAPPSVKRHVTFDPEEDDKEFDRQIREAFGE
ncbi:MAG: hypothetical protein ACFFD6_01490 [Candidatus Thorarchaeota archaeon]